MKQILSSTNPEFKKLLSLTSSKGIKTEGLCILSGKDQIAEFLQGKKDLSIYAEVISASKKLAHNPISPNARLLQLETELFSQLDTLGTDFNLLIVETSKIEPMPSTLLSEPNRTVLLAMGDPGNLGAALRNCDAFGVEKVVLLKEAANPFLPKSIKASAGSALRLNLFSGPSIQDISGSHGSDLMALDMNGQDISKIKYNSFKLLVGEEGKGIPAGFKGQRLKIPTRGVESLNATVSLGIALFALRKS